MVALIPRLKSYLAALAGLVWVALQFLIAASILGFILAYLPLRAGVAVLGLVWGLAWYAISGHYPPPSLDLIEQASGAWLVWLSLGIGAGIYGMQLRQDSQDSGNE